MKKKANRLIVASVIGLIALSVVQAYLINNTYKLKREAFVQETRPAIARLSDQSFALDSLSYIWIDNLLSSLTDYKVKSIEKSEVVKNLQISIDSINDAYNQTYQEELSRKKVEYRIKYQKQIRDINFTRFCIK